MLDKYGIRKAVVSSFTARNLEVAYGNELVFEAARQDERLIPCPVVVPDAGMEVGEEGAYLDRLIRDGARWAAFYPKTCGTTLDKRIIGSLFSALEKRRMPVAVFESELLEVATLADAYPGLPVVLHVPPARARVLLPALRASPNIYISIAPNFAPYRGLEVLVREIGADRILFATGYPVSEPGAALGFLFLSPISDKEVEQIAWRNTDRLLRGVLEADTLTNPRVTAVPACSEKRTHRKRIGGVCTSVWRRERVPWEGIVDMHGHYGAWAKFPIWGGKADDLVEEMDRVGVRKLFVSHHACLSTEVVWGNNEVLEAIRRRPGRIFGYAICYPVDETLGIREVERCIEAGMHGIKLHNCNGFAYTDERLAPVWDYADSRKLPVLLHTWGDIDKMEAVFENYQQAPILLGHAGAANPKMYVKYTLKFPNLYLELCGSQSRYGLVEYFVREVGAGRVVFGSDVPWMPIQHQLGRVLFADIPEADKRAILVENPKRILEGVTNGH
jgi:predicted TIM-barrel fold metal-dependent hydrolase